MIPKPILKERIIDPAVYAESLKQGFDPFLARVIAGRPIAFKTNPEKSIQPKLADLSPPWGLASLSSATRRLVQAIQNEEIIGLETDHDCDGQTAHAVLYTALVEHFRVPAERIRSYIGHRLQEGYGLSERLAQRILEDPTTPSLVITADNGSSDEPRIAQLKAAGIDVVVTDHHEIPYSGIPSSAVAVLNPNQEACAYGDKSVAGCMVAWLYMASVRHALIEEGYLPKNAPHLADLLDFVAVGTIADCVSMANSINNRAVVRYGLQLLQKRLRPCWKVLQKEKLLNCEFLAFQLAPLLNSDGRIATAMGSVSFLLAKTEQEAREWLDHLQLCNQERKSIQKQLLEKSLKEASQQYQRGACALSIFLKEGHPGVHGIVASKLKESFGLPTAMLAPKGEDLISGSIRGVPGVHVRKALQYVYEQIPEKVVAFGGHQGAAGITLKAESLALFTTAFETAVRLQLGQTARLGPVLYFDGAIDPSLLTCGWTENLWNTLAPFGREFEAPLFELKGTVVRVQNLGQEGLHARLGVRCQGVLLECTWFYMTEVVKPNDTVRLLCTPKINFFRGEQRLELQVAYLEQVFILSE